MQLEQGPAYVTEPFVSLSSTQLKLNGIHTDEEGTIHDPALLMEVCLFSLCALTLILNSQFFVLFFPLFLHVNRDILYLNMTLGWDLVVLHTTPSMFGKNLVHVWR